MFICVCSSAHSISQHKTSVKSENIQQIMIKNAMKPFIIKSK